MLLTSRGLALYEFVAERNTTDAQVAEDDLLTFVAYDGLATDPSDTAIAAFRTAGTNAPTRQYGSTAVPSVVVRGWWDVGSLTQTPCYYPTVQDYYRDRVLDLRHRRGMFASSDPLAFATPLRRALLDYHVAFTGTTIRTTHGFVRWQVASTQAALTAAEAVPNPTPLRARWCQTLRARLAVHTDFLAGFDREFPCVEGCDDPVATVADDASAAARCAFEAVGWNVFVDDGGGFPSPPTAVSRAKTAFFNDGAERSLAALATACSTALRASSLAFVEPCVVTLALADADVGMPWLTSMTLAFWARRLQRLRSLTAAMEAAYRAHGLQSDRLTAAGNHVQLAASALHALLKSQREQLGATMSDLGGIDTPTVTTIETSAATMTTLFDGIEARLKQIYDGPIDTINYISTSSGRFW
jgi:hypothetical protein